MESRPQNSKFKNNPESFHSCSLICLKSIFTQLPSEARGLSFGLNLLMFYCVCMSSEDTNKTACICDKYQDLM